MLCHAEKQTEKKTNFYLISSGCNFDQALALTTSLVRARPVAEKQQNDVLTKAHPVQSALETVRSVECGLFA